MVKKAGPLLASLWMQSPMEKEREENSFDAAWLGHSHAGELVGARCLFQEVHTNCVKKAFRMAFLNGNAFGLSACFMRICLGVRSKCSETYILRNTIGSREIPPSS
ncbi:hypothetical protein F1559_002128 [Cyanidiococcus yangmingshanensis]|uniref:Uncharacterized protein n=1 Tax=Cyanidiococcus yangmingshanensis TaxID=2690220 RepID=A0A7J7IP10_9RHOD|nr:hypothetical protein F1559_002128 [Cyanidiococcus yangmingshanensis]